MKTTAPFLGNERTPSGRMDEIDYLKCVCILLMVVFHLAYIGDKYPYAKLVVYTFHMPVFLLISGYLTHIGKPAREFLRKYLWIFIPYAVMETGYAVASSLLPVRQGLEELSLPAVVEALFVSPVGPYWYLHTLMLCLVSHYLVSRYVRGNALTKLIVLGLCLAGLHGCGLLSFTTAMYFAMGCAVRWGQADFSRLFRPSWLATVPLVWLCSYPSNLDRGCLAGVCIVYLCFCLLLATYRLLSPRLRGAACFIGRNTLPIFLFSPMFTMASKFFLPFFTVFDASGMAFMFVAVSLAVAGSLGIAWAMDRLGLSRWFFGRRECLAR